MRPGRFGVFAAMVFFMLSVFYTVAFSKAVESGQEVRRFDVKDVLGRIIFGKDLEGWIVIYGFGDEKSAEKTLDFIKKLVEAEPNAEGILYVCVADMGKYSSKILRPFVKKVLKKEYRKQMKKLGEVQGERDGRESVPLEDRYILIADMKGDVFKLFGIEDQRNVAQIFILDGNHEVRGHFTEYSDAMPEILRLVLAERDTERMYALKTKKKKKNMVKRYVIGGALLWLLLK